MKNINWQNGTLTADGRHYGYIRFKAENVLSTFAPNLSGEQLMHVSGTSLVRPNNELSMPVPKKKQKTGRNAKEWGAVHVYILKTVL